jgi:CelD/BcsL family acetyltransferase involved in cellulose biosynthesis
MRVEISSDPRAFVARDWSQIVAADQAATFFHQPRYLKLYWEEFGHEGDLLLAFGLDEEGSDVGAVAFERIGTTLRFLGGTEVTDYMGPVALPGQEDAFAKELFDALHGVEGWTDADLRGLPEDSPWLERLREAAGASGLAVETAEDAVAPFLALPGSVEEYMTGLPGKLRHEIKRKARKLREESGGYRLVRTTAATLSEDLDCFIQLHRSSEGPKGKFMEPGMEIFFRRLGGEFVDDDVFRLTFVEIGDEKVAGAIGFSSRGTFLLYNSAYDRGWAGLAPGMVLVGDLVMAAIEQGCDAFDMLKGDLQYKYRFGAVPRPVRRLVIERR